MRFCESSSGASIDAESARYARSFNSLPGWEPMFLSIPRNEYDPNAPTLEVSHGTVVCDDMRFEPSAMVANGDWAPLDLQSLRDFGIKLGTDRRHNTIAIVPIPDRVVDLFRPSLTRYCAGETIYFDDAQISAATRALADHVVAFTQWRFEPGSMVGGGFRVGAGNLRNTTINTQTGKFVGLHIDSWDRACVASRWMAQNRICLNLGDGDRALQFVPMQAQVFDGKQRDREASRDLGRPPRASTSNSLDMARSFLSQFPETNVIRLRVKPGEAYIAPTENVIHDGSALSTAPDVTFTLRGRIALTGRDST